MIVKKWQRDLARAVMTIAASSCGETFEEIAATVALDSHGMPRRCVVLLARRAMAASLEAGNWREQRAEAAQKLREGWVTQ